MAQGPAVELAIDGVSYGAIAAEVGYSHRGTAYKAVHKALAERVTVSVDQWRRLELDRLDALQVALWPHAMAGDTATAGVVLRIIEQRARVLGIGSGSARETGTRLPTTVVVSELAAST